MCAWATVPVHTTSRPAVRGERLEARPLRTVADKQKGRIVEARDRGDRLIERMKSAEAADPADDVPVAQTEEVAHRRAVRGRA
jgi:hypothetical protein